MERWTVAGPLLVAGGSATRGNGQGNGRTHSLKSVVRRKRGRTSAGLRHFSADRYNWGFPPRPHCTTGRSFNGRTRGSGPRYRGSNPCLPAKSASPFLPTHLGSVRARSIVSIDREDFRLDLERILKLCPGGMRKVACATSRSLASRRKPVVPRAVQRRGLARVRRRDLQIFERLVVVAFGRRDRRVSEQIAHLCEWDALLNQP